MACDQFVIQSNPFSAALTSLHTSVLLYIKASGYKQFTNIECDPTVYDQTEYAERIRRAALRLQMVEANFHASKYIL